VMHHKVTSNYDRNDVPKKRRQEKKTRREKERRRNESLTKRLVSRV